MDQSLEEVLDICLAKLKQGKTLEDILRAYPQYAKELRPLLEMALSIEEMPKPRPREEAVDAMLVRMGEALVVQSEERPALGKRFLRPLIGKPVLVRALATVLVVIVAVWSMGMVSSRAIPGDLLYPIKSSSEKVRFSLTRGVEGRIALRLEFADRRLEELVKVLARRGYLSEEALHALLKEAELALDDAQTLDEDSYELFLAKLDHFNNCTKDVLERMKPGLTDHECSMVDDAIKVCHNRSQHMNTIRKRNGKQMDKGKWGPGCKWR